MANKPKPQPESSRRATVEAMRREQQRKERRKTMLFVGLAALLGLGLIAAAAVPAFMERRNDPTKKAFATFGVTAAKAGCDKVIDDEATGENEHVGDGEVVDYKAAPPSSGKHYNTPALDGRSFYTTKDAPPVEQLVHNLEHGFTIVWYDSTMKGEQLETLERLAKRGVAATKQTAGKFIVAPWDAARGKFPEGKRVALTHWSRGTGHRQYCGQVSGEAVEDFIEKYPWSDAPEAGA